LLVLRETLTCFNRLNGDIDTIDSLRETLSFCWS
jgi:hypothetical protein